MESWYSIVVERGSHPNAEGLCVRVHAEFRKRIGETFRGKLLFLISGGICQIAWEQRPVL